MSHWVPGCIMINTVIRGRQGGDHCDQWSYLETNLREDWSFTITVDTIKTLVGAISVIVKHQTFQRFVSSTSDQHRSSDQNTGVACICVSAQSADARVDAMTRVWAHCCLAANLIKDGFQFAKLQQLSRGQQQQNIIGMQQSTSTM